MRLKICPKLALLVGLQIFAFSLTAATAEESVPQQYKKKVEAMKGKVGEIEKKLDKITSEKTVGIDALNIDELMQDHATEASRAFEVVQTEMKRAAKTKEQKGSLDIGRDFEKVIREQQSKAEDLIGRIMKIEADVRTAKIQVSKDIANEWTPEETKEFRESLTPEADKKYREIMPSLFKEDVSHLSDEQWRAKQEICLARLEAVKRLDRSILDGVMDILVPPAEAVLAVGCVAICKASLGTACFSCISAAGAAAVGAYAVQTRCLSSCDCGCKWYRPGCCLCKGACWVAFLAALG